MSDTITRIACTVPEKLSGKKFEELVLFRARKLEKKGILTLSRYGVQASFVDKEWRPIDSYPDFDGCIAPHGRELIAECKVSSSNTLDFTQSKAKAKQIEHMILRANFGAACYLLVHFNERRLKTRTDPAATYAVPVHERHPFWGGYLRKEEKNLTRQQAELYGVPIEWNLWSPQATKPTPDISALVDPSC